MSEEKQPQQHWKSLRDDRFIGAYTLIEREVSELKLRLTHVSHETVNTIYGTEQKVLLAYFENEKPLWLLDPHQISLTKLFGTGIVQKWVNKDVTLYLDKVLDKKNTFASIEDSWIDVIRFREVSEDGMEELDPFHPKWEKICQAVKCKNITIEQLKQKFKISEGTELALIDLL